VGVDRIKAEHVTLVLTGAIPRLEVQLLKYHQPEPTPDQDIINLSKLGFNHICFAVDDIEEEVKRLLAHGIKMRNEIMDFHGR
jgi:catechol 2,3-dioxygenase-like lactoylglutathione lyase family enzyme